MGNLALYGFSILTTLLGCFAFAGANKGARYCSETQFQQCMQNNPSDPSVCGYKFQDCYFSNGGAILRSNGTSVQMFDPNNKDFQACQGAGSTSAIQSCINQRVQARSGRGSSGSDSTVTTAPAATDASPDISSTTAEESTQDSQSDNTNTYTFMTSCMKQMSGLVEACRNETSSAVNSCDDTKDPEMNSTMKTLQTTAVVLGQQTASSIQAACSKMASLSQAANAAVAAYQMNCSTTIDSCRSACQQAVSFWKSNNACVESSAMGPPPPAPPADLYNEAQNQMNTCQSLSAKADQAKQALANYALTAGNAQKCSDSTSGTSGVTPEICKANPNLVGCTAAGTVDCTKPEMASNKVCMCSKNPNDPSCIGTKSTGNNGPTGSAELSSLNKSSVDNIAGDINGLPLPDQAKADPGLAGSVVDGHQGGGANLGGGSDSFGGSGVGHEGSAGKGSVEVPAVTGGFYSGGGGGSFGSKASASEGSHGEGVFDRLGNAVKQGATDLRKFLPGGQMDPRLRGFAGASGPDGITGPHSDIWQKIQNRYRVLESSLMP